MIFEMRDEIKYYKPMIIELNKMIFHIKKQIYHSDTITSKKALEGDICHVTGSNAFIGHVKNTSFASFLLISGYPYI